MDERKGFKKIRKLLTDFSEIIEIILAFMVAAAIVIGVIHLFPQLADLGKNLIEDEHAFEKFLSTALNVVVGTEFINMLLKPSFENVAEVLIFLIARHMVVTETSPMDNLISVISIAILFILRFILPEKNRKRMAEIREKTLGLHAEGTFSEDTSLKNVQSEQSKKSQE